MRAIFKTFRTLHLLTTIIVGLALSAATAHASVIVGVAPPVPELIVFNARITTQNPDNRRPVRWRSATAFSRSWVMTKRFSL